MNKVILLIEDDKKDEILIKRSLEKERIANEIIVLRDGAEAVQYLMDDNNPLPTVTLLDLNLPKLSGLEVLKHIRNNKRTKLLPVVILSSSDEDKDIINCYNNGANSYVCKPVDFDAFSRAIHEVGVFWLVTNKEQPLM